MPLFAVICRDRKDSQALRMENRAAHLAYCDQTGNVLFGGPFVDSGQMVGSLLVIDCADIEAARDWVADDPYGKAGLFESVTLDEWKRVIG